MSNKKIAALSLVAIATFMVAAATLVSMHQAFASCTTTGHVTVCVQQNVNNNQNIKGNPAGNTIINSPSHSTQSQTVCIRVSQDKLDCHKTS
jgi:hypothetical protein